MTKKYSHLTESDRFEIQRLLALGNSQRSIALGLGVDPSTVSRELLRARTFEGRDGSYFAVLGQRARIKGRANAGRHRLKLGSAFDSPLAAAVLMDLKKGWSPEQVCGRMKLPNLDEPAVATPVAPAAAASVSHETIYAAIYAQPRGALRSELVKALRCSRGGRLPRARGKSRFSAIQNASSIDLRPAEVAGRVVPGHWEGDLIKGARNASAVGTLVERTSRFLILAKMDALDSVSVTRSFAHRLRRVPMALRKTLTYDRGTEMSTHQDLAKRLHIDIFFCDAYEPSQRGTNENTNGLIRQYLPKGTDLSVYSAAQLKTIEDALNNRPRKILGYLTPAEVFSKLKLNSAKSVALRT
jgi:transposase, IS30 family